LAEAGLSIAKPPLGTAAPRRAAGQPAARIAFIGQHGDLIVLGMLALVVSALLVPAAISLPLQIPHGYNEGWNAYQALRAVGEQPLYPPLGDLTADNYPPLSFYLIGWAGKIFGDHIVIGRTIALVSLLVVACNLGLIVRTLGGTWRAAAFGALLFLGHIVVHAPVYVGMNDPQLLAHALMTTALVVFLRGGRSSLYVVATAALALLSGFVKHSLIPLPLAITAWLWWHDRRAFWVWLTASAVLLLGCVALLYMTYGPVFFLDVFSTPRTYSLGRLARRSSDMLWPVLPALGASLLLLAAEPRGAGVQLLALYALFAGLWGVFILGGAGTDVNALFDLVICTTIAATLALERLPTALPGMALLRTAGMVALMLPVLVSAPLQLSQKLSMLQNLDRVRGEIADDIRFIAAQDGPVVCETLALCYWAGKDFQVDLFNTGQKFEKGAIDENAFMQALREHRFAAFQVCGHGVVLVSHHRLPSAIDRVLRESYRVGRSSPAIGLILVPRLPGVSSQAEPTEGRTGFAGQDTGWAC
jgi:hypothetical protein